MSTNKRRINLPKRRHRRKKPRPLYARLTRVLLHHPPIKHRGSGDRRLVSPFEFAIAAGLNALASCALAEEFHRRALKGGAKAIEAEQQTGATTKKIYRRDTAEKSPPPPAAMCRLMGITNYRVDKRGESHWTTNRRQAFKEAGARGYRRRMQWLKQQPLPGTVTLEITRKHLLRVAGLSINGTSLNKVGAALRRLSKRVAVDRQNLAPLIERWEQLPSGRLQLVVSTTWMQKPFGRIPIPLPSARAPIAMAIYLFLFTIKTTEASAGSISFASLCRRLGICTSYGQVQASRVLCKAMAIVNEHLEKLDAEALDDAGIRLPVSFKIVGDSDGRVQFKQNRRQQRDNDDEDETSTVISEASDDDDKTKAEEVREWARTRWGGR